MRAAFAACEDFVATGKEQLRRNFNTLVAAMGINLTRLCQYTDDDPSTIFRIRNGSRRPADSRQFAGAVASFVAREVVSPRELEALAELLACPAEDIADLSFRYTRLCSWLMQEQPARSEGDITDFLSKLDEFDLNEYIKAIHFDELKVPHPALPVPHRPHRHHGLGHDGQRSWTFSEGHRPHPLRRPGDHVQAICPWPRWPCTPEFPKKWMFGMAALLKKGLHLHQHPQPGPLLLRGYDAGAWRAASPMYMTGQIFPIRPEKRARTTPFLHLLKVSGAAALSGEAIAGHHAEGRYYLTKSKCDAGPLRHAGPRPCSDSAYPLMDIYRE